MDVVLSYLIGVYVFLHFETAPAPALAGGTPQANRRNPFRAAGRRDVVYRFHDGVIPITRAAQPTIGPQS